MINGALEKISNEKYCVSKNTEWNTIPNYVDLENAGNISHNPNFYWF